jgi:hypothetical protein
MNQEVLAEPFLWPETGFPESFSYFLVKRDAPPAPRQIGFLRLQDKVRVRVELNIIALSAFQPIVTGKRNHCRVIGAKFG